MALTPMMRQYFEVKETAKDCILFFRLGDFYEMFFDDAITASKELEVALTGRDCGLEERAPMCGVPYHAANNYIRILINKGYKVALCEQVEDPAVAKGIVKREVVKVFTPGTYTDSQFLQEDKNNYVMSLYIDDQKNIFSMAFGDLSTGELYCTEDRLNEQYIFNEIAKFNPSEIILQEDISTDFLKLLDERFYFSKSTVEKSYYTSVSEEELKSQFLNYGELDIPKELKYSINALIKYIDSNLKLSPSHMNFIDVYNVVEFLNIDANSKRNLELTETLKDKKKKGSLLWVLDNTETAMGARLLRKWVDQPLINKSAIEKRLEAVEEILNDISLQSDLKDSLNNIYDIERLIGKVSTNNILPKEMYSLKLSIEKLPIIYEVISNCSSSLFKDMYLNLDKLEDIHKILDNALTDNPPMSLKDGGIIREGYNSEIDSLREAKINGKRWLADLEAKERDAIGIKSLKIKHNKVFGYYIEITNANLNAVPEGRYIRKQTLSNAERFITPELKEMEDKILGAEEGLIELEYNLFIELRSKLQKEINRMKKSAKIISEIDCLYSLGLVARNNNYVKPSINTQGIINVKDGRHPVVEKVIPRNTFVENDVYVDNKDSSMILITGPNMAGKSTYMRQIALTTLMAQIGSFVPASYADISICDKIFTRIGASDDLASGKSTFMVEMWEVANILNNATKNSLVLLDEVGRGTSTYDGLSIAWSVIEYMCNSEQLRCKTLFATHYHELIKLEGIIPGIKNYSVAIKEINDELVFLRKVVRGGTDDSYGIEVAKLAGIPVEVVTRAKAILKDLEKGNNISICPVENLLTAEVAVDKEVMAENEVSYKTENSHEIASIKVEDIQEAVEIPKTVENSFVHEETIKKSNNIHQMDFMELSKNNLLGEIKDIDILNMTPMEGFNALYELIKKAKKM